MGTSSHDRRDAAARRDERPQFFRFRPSAQGVESSARHRAPPAGASAPGAGDSARSARDVGDVRFDVPCAPEKAELADEASLKILRRHGVVAGDMKHMSPALGHRLPTTQSRDVASRDIIEEADSGMQRSTETRTVKAHINRLRETKAGTNWTILVTAERRVRASPRPSATV